ncbi:MAG: hypothetical protein UU12_C0046G0003 [Candidatus Woesebacteria bacterium GW2011_GWA2_40_7b]|uniref:Uncharacterized protein n=1 Tax=Candidatus Woesebacteria bacterium GW2011_GWA2_40_7b TaxID=1618563 RepID=A0A0G0SWQ7_9BACT|nr:MAG: hypothetical protein UU12_C0046G0003 [Candidatus Woesebacteria bacterium GW2011_GWA2_40_7b]
MLRPVNKRRESVDVKNIGKIIDCKVGKECKEYITCQVFIYLSACKAAIINQV